MKEKDHKFEGKIKCPYCGSSDLGSASNITKNIMTGKLTHRYVSDCYDCGEAWYSKTRSF